MGEYMDRFELYYQYALSKIQEQNERKQSLEVKARNSIGLSIALLGVAGLMVSSFATDSVNKSDFAWTVIGLIIALFLLSVAFSIRTLYVYEWYINPAPQTFQENIQNRDYTEEGILEWAADDMLSAYSLNELTLQDKDAKLRRHWHLCHFRARPLGC